VQNRRRPAMRRWRCASAAEGAGTRDDAITANSKTCYRRARKVICAASDCPDILLMVAFLSISAPLIFQSAFTVTILAARLSAARHYLRHATPPDRCARARATHPATVAVPSRFFFDAARKKWNNSHPDATRRRFYVTRRAVVQRYAAMRR